MMVTNNDHPSPNYNYIIIYIVIIMILWIVDGRNPASPWMVETL